MLSNRAQEPEKVERVGNRPSRRYQPTAPQDTWKTWSYSFPRSEPLDQTVKSDQGKPKVAEVPTELLYGAARAKDYGTMKYNAPDNWKQVELGRWKNGLMRHFLSYLGGEVKDDESGLSHLDHMACTLAYIMYLEEHPDEQR